VARVSAPQSVRDALADAERRAWLQARGWVDAHSGQETWRVLEVGVDGFRYDGPGFFSPRFKSWTDHYAEAWAKWARRAVPARREAR
jgi:hypothetical protein